MPAKVISDKFIHEPSIGGTERLFWINALASWSQSVPRARELEYYTSCCRRPVIEGRSHG
jgi:hypothetical protein